MNLQSSSEQLYQPRCIWPVGAELGEGPLWLPGESLLYFVDIKGQRLHRCDASGLQRQSWIAPQPIGFVQPLRNGGLIAGMKDGLYRFGGSVFEKVYAVEDDLPGNRLNDAFTDHEGHLWFGSMDDAEQAPTGSLFRLEDDRHCAVKDNGYVITNGPAISPDRRHFYHTDTLAQIVYVFDLDAHGDLSNKRALIHIRDGYPDGTAIDSGGDIWVALFAGGRVERYAPTGVLRQTVRMPCSNVTKLTFGGPDLRTAFVTTACKGLGAEQRKAEPLAGGVFSFVTDTPGQPQAFIQKGI